MKKFSFIINNFYTIFDQMPNDKKNVDSILEDKIKKSLYNNTSSEFSFELMKRVELQKEFAKDDIKTGKLVKYITGVVIFMMLGFSFLITYMLSRTEYGIKGNYYTTIIDRFTNFIENISTIVTQNLGFTFNFQTGLILLLIMVCIFMFSFADKIIIKKSFK